jgi:hypothetical protein
MRVKQAGLLLCRQTLRLAVTRLEGRLGVRATTASVHSLNMKCAITRSDKYSKNQIKPQGLQPCRAQAAVNTVPEPELVRMRSRWLACSPNTRNRIILIQQQEPSGSEARESWVRGRE